MQLLLKRTLTPHFDLELASNLQEARNSVFGKQKLDLITLDLNLPDGDGLRFCSELRASPQCENIPIFILSGNHSISEKMHGFQLGIEDYIVKPFEPMELKARIEARLKKISSQQIQENIIKIGKLIINLSCHRIELDLKKGPLRIDLSTTEFKILSYLARHQGQVKSREQIISTVWGEDLHLTDRTVDSHISRIRKKIKECDGTIESVPNAGYRYVQA